jgi:serine/threonine-protein kinase
LPPKSHGTYALKKAEELFTREAGVLYKFQHPQIPKFRELSRFNVGSESGLFLVQDYVAGQTYRAILTHRQHQGYLFKEAEVLDLLRQLLPVLDYIHSQGVIHRDIAPDNLILRSSDQLPVLIDFGGVKEIAATIQQSQSVAGGKKPKTPRVSTRVGKLGYAPEEQMLLGRVYPHSDLYALAVTVLVLLTGKEPQALFDSHNMCWVWQKFVTVSPNLTIVLEKMLVRQQSDRFQSAKEVLQALGFWSSGTPSIPNPSPNLPTQSPPELSQPVSQPAAPTSVSLPPSAVSLPPTAPPQPSHQEVLGFFGKLLLLLTIAIVAGSGGWWVATRWLQSNHRQNVTHDSIASESDNAAESSELADKTEAELKAELQDKRKALKINQSFF